MKHVSAEPAPAPPSLAERVEEALAKSQGALAAAAEVSRRFHAYSGSEAVRRAPGTHPGRTLYKGLTNCPGRHGSVIPEANGTGRA